MSIRVESECQRVIGPIAFLSYVSNALSDALSGHSNEDLLLVPSQTETSLVVISGIWTLSQDEDKRGFDMDLRAGISELFKSRWTTTLKIIKDIQANRIIVICFPPFYILRPYGTRQGFL